MVEIKQEERVGSPFIQCKITFYIYVRIVEMKFIKFVGQIHSPLQEQERSSKFGCISRVSHLTNRPYSESVVLGEHFFNFILTLPSLQAFSCLIPLQMKCLLSHSSGDDLKIFPFISNHQ